MTEMVTRSRSKKQRKYFEEEQEDNTELLPGLPNDVTVQLISTKLPWRTFHVLPLVSRAWLGAIRSGEINDARVRSRTTETLVVIDIECSVQDFIYHTIGLYSLRDKAFYRLPPLPAYPGSIPTGCRCITMGGKIYMLGGVLDVKVWVLDIARQKKWQECASVHTPRKGFGCAVFEGKIYIFGGWNFSKCPRQPIFGCWNVSKLGQPILSSEVYDRQPIFSSEVYDPKVDEWTKISPMKSPRVNFEAFSPMEFTTLNLDAGVVGDEILVHGKNVERGGSHLLDGMEAYNPAKDSWRTISPVDFREDEFNRYQEKLFTAHGRLHSLTQRKIVVFDFDKKLFKDLHTCSVESKSKTIKKKGRSRRSPQGYFLPRAVLATDDGLLTAGHFQRYGPPFDNDCKLYQSGMRQLGTGKKKIALEEVECSHLVRVRHCPFLRPIQL